jgi:hypothetical protein
MLKKYKTYIENISSLSKKKFHVSTIIPIANEIDIDMHRMALVT